MAGGSDMTAENSLQSTFNKSAFFIAAHVAVIVAAHAMFPGIGAGIDNLFAQALGDGVADAATDTAFSGLETLTT